MLPVVEPAVSVALEPTVRVPPDCNVMLPAVEVMLLTDMLIPVGVVYWKLPPAAELVTRLPDPD